MKDKLSIIGGDLRIKKLAEMLSNDGIKVYTYGLGEINKTVECKSIKELVNSTDTIIGPIPFSRDNKTINATFVTEQIRIEDLVKEMNNKIFIAGAIKDDIYVLLKDKNVKVIDILKKEELSVLNSISTAEGAIQIAMEQTEITLNGSNILILGFGRIGKVLAKMLVGIGANVYCEARKQEDLAWIDAYGYNKIPLKNLNENLGKFDIIFNTIPYIILDKNNLNKIKKDCIIVDLASNPGGADKEEVKAQNLNYICALGLPGKIAPTTSAKFIKNVLYNL